MSWTDKLKSALNSVKDSGASAAIRAWLSREMADYGELLDFNINSREHRAELHVLLKGETVPLTIVIEDYEVASTSGVDFVTVKCAHASREWVNAVLRNFVIGKRHAIPNQYATMARLVLSS